MPNCEAEELCKAIDKNTRFHNGAGHTIKRIHMDVEFKPSMDKVEDKMNTKMNCANKGEHVPEAERTIKH